MAFDREGCLYITVGERCTRENAQQLKNFSGKVHRINDDGTIPRDNPFAKDFSSVSSIYSYGRITSYNVCYTKLLRSLQGRMACLPGTGKQEHCRDNEQSENFHDNKYTL